MSAKRFTKLTVLSVLLLALLAGAAGAALPPYGSLSGSDAVYAAPARLSKDALYKALEHCQSVPELADSPRFSSLLEGAADPVILSSDDVKMLYLYDSTSETVRETRRQCAETGCTVFLMEMENGPSYAADTSAVRPEREALLLEYLGWVGSNVDNLARKDDLSWISSLFESGEDPLVLLARAMNG